MPTLPSIALEVTYDGRCFGCGPQNSEGLRMAFQPLDGESVAEYEVPDQYQSWSGIVHGGMVALMLDEAVGWASWHAGHPGVTGRLEVRYRQPLKLGERVRVSGRVDRIRRTLIYASARIERVADRSTVAEASATLMEAPAVVEAYSSGSPGQ